MSSNAPAQLLGYTLQFPRALYHLLKSGPGDSVSIEVVGDVATHKQDKTVIAEEDKSSTVGNPLTDRSVDFWKTFFNWIEAVKSNTLSIEKTYFILYSNQSGRKAFVDKFDKASTLLEAQKCITEVKTSLTDITDTHEIWKFYNYVVNENEEILAQLIPKFELQIDAGLGYTEIAYELKRIHVPESQINFISDHLNGWLQKFVLSRIVEKKQAVATWDEFNHQYSVLFNRAQRLELIDFTLLELPHPTIIQQQVRLKPEYLKLLEDIEAEDDEILEAVSDYIRAKVNRDKWIESEIIDEEVASDFESKLLKFWENQRKRIEITQKTLEECDRGKLLYVDCRIRQETIRDMSPPSTTIAGTYHLLANGKNLGWHPNWSSEKLNK